MKQLRPSKAPLTRPITFVENENQPTSTTIDFEVSSIHSGDDEVLHEDVLLMAMEDLELMAPPFPVDPGSTDNQEKCVSGYTLSNLARSSPNGCRLNDTDRVQLRDQVVNGVVENEYEILQLMNLQDKPETANEIPKEIDVRFHEIFGDLPDIDGHKEFLIEMDLQLRKGSEQTSVRMRPYPCSLRDESEIEAQLSELEAKGLIERPGRNEIPKYASPCFLVEKPGQPRKRLVCDFSKLNKHLETHAGSLPRMETLLHRLGRFRWKTVVDLRSGFWQVGMTANASSLSAFISPGGEIWKWR